MVTFSKFLYNLNSKIKCLPTNKLCKNYHQQTKIYEQRYACSQQIRHLTTVTEHGGHGRCGHCLQLNNVQRFSHDWKGHMHYSHDSRKVIPRLLYLHNPWKYAITKFNLIKLKLTWDRDFVEKEFIYGTKQVCIGCNWMLSIVTSEH